MNPFSILSLLTAILLVGIITLINLPNPQQHEHCRQQQAMSTNACILELTR